MSAITEAAPVRNRNRTIKRQMSSNLFKGNSVSDDIERSLDSYLAREKTKSIFDTLPVCQPRNQGLWLRAGFNAEDRSRVRRSIKRRGWSATKCLQFLKGEISLERLYVRLHVTVHAMHLIPLLEVLKNDDVLRFDLAVRRIECFPVFLQSPMNALDLGKPTFTSNVAEDLCIVDLLAIKN